MRFSRPDKATLICFDPSSVRRGGGQDKVTPGHHLFGAGERRGGGRRKIIVRCNSSPFQKPNKKREKTDPPDACNDIIVVGK